MLVESAQPERPGGPTVPPSTSQSKGVLVMNEPVTTMDTRYSEPDGVVTPWEQTRRVLETAELFWLSTVRAGRCGVARRGHPLQHCRHRTEGRQPAWEPTRDSDDWLQPLGGRARRRGRGRRRPDHQPGHARTLSLGVGYQVGRTMAIPGARRLLLPP